tara:strand:+ start:1871 stop:2332 length:462 start_codon:yes stop_codon:yes gene_type:complete
MEHNIDIHKIIDQLEQLGLNTNGDEFPYYVAARSSNGYLHKNIDLTIGKFKDSTYFIFENNELLKIGKVGGGDRCLCKRVYDYRSKDPTGVLISESIKEGNEIIILAINFTPEPEKIYGVLTEGSVRGPKLEKSLLEIARNLNINLKWNKNKG